MELKVLNFCLNFSVRRGMYEGREHLIAPATILCEGVHSGSGGSLFYPSSELSMFPGAWNGVPVTLNHPEVEGVPVSANSPEIAEKALGRLWNVEYTDNKLRGEVWVDIAKARQYAPEVLARLQSGQVTEVSTGLFTQDDPTEGTWNGENYTAIARGYRPDHLAILPSSRGACSVADGCGLGVNELCQRGNESCLKNNGGKMSKEKQMPVKSVEDHRGFLRRVLSLMTNDASFEDTQRGLQAKLDALDSPTAFHYLRKVYDTHFVYEVGPGPESGRTERKLYRRNYSMTDSGVTLGEDPVEVREETNYVEIQNNSETKKEEEKNMSDCKQKVNELIANGAFEESDRPMLEKMECSQVTRLGERFQALSAKPEPAKPEPAVPAEPATPAVNAEKKLTVEDLPEEFQALLRNAKAQDDRRKAELVGKIAKFKGNKFTEDGLKALSVAELENIHDLVSANAPGFVDYSFAGGVVSNEDEEEPLETPTMNWEEKK